MSESPYADNINDDYNPFQAPESADHGGGFGASHVEAIRREHLSHEASVKSIGSLYLLGGVLMLFGSIFGIAMSAGAGRGPAGPNELVVFALLFVFAAVQLATAVGLQRLRPWARIVAGIFSTIGLIGFPIGTLISAYFLYLLFSTKGTMVFSDEYKSVIKQTPHIVYKTSIIVWIFVFLLLGLLGFVLVRVFFA